MRNFQQKESRWDGEITLPIATMLLNAELNVGGLCFVAANATQPPETQ